MQANTVCLRSHQKCHLTAEVVNGKITVEKGNLVQKGYGWLLKVASHLHQKEVFDYVMKNKKKMPRTSLRYAIEKMPQSLRQEAMKR